MEETGEKPTDAEDSEEIFGMVQITVYNDCFSIEHTSNLDMNDLAGLFIASLEKLDGEMGEHVVH